MKAVGRGHGHLAPREAALTPWRNVAVDLIGPWEINCAGHVLKYNALTIIDMVTNLVEVVRIENKTAEHMAGFLNSIGYPNIHYHLMSYTTKVENS